MAWARGSQNSVAARSDALSLGHWLSLVALFFFGGFRVQVFGILTRG